MTRRLKRVSGDVLSGKRITFAPTDQVESFGVLVNDFMSSIFELEPGTRAPVQTLLDYLEAGDSIDDFLAGFPTVTRDHVVAFLERGAALAANDAA